MNLSPQAHPGLSACLLCRGSVSPITYGGYITAIRCTSAHEYSVMRAHGSCGSTQMRRPRAYDGLYDCSCGVAYGFYDSEGPHDFHG